MNTKHKVMALAAVPAAALVIGGSVGLAQASTTAGQSVTSGHGMHSVSQQTQLHSGARAQTTPAQPHAAIHAAVHHATAPTQMAVHHPVVATTPVIVMAHHPVATTVLVPMPMHHGTVAAAAPRTGTSATSTPVPGPVYGNHGSSGNPTGPMGGSAGSPGCRR